jgi:hypothetical protein
MSDLIPQPHGGALAPQFAPGNGMARRGTSMRAARKHCRELLLNENATTIKALISRRDSPDERVSIVAIQEINNRLWGRVGDNGWAAEDAERRLDFSHLSHEKQMRAAELLAELQQLLGPEDAEDG